MSYNYIHEEEIRSKQIFQTGQHCGDNFLPSFLPQVLGNVTFSNASIFVNFCYCRLPTEAYCQNTWGKVLKKLASKVNTKTMAFWLKQKGLGLAYTWFGEP